MTKQEQLAELIKKEQRYELAKKSGSLPEALLNKEAEKIKILKEQIDAMPNDEPVKIKQPIAKPVEVTSQRSQEEIDQEINDQFPKYKQNVQKRKAYQNKKEYY